MKWQTLKPYHAKTFARNKSDTGKRGLVIKNYIEVHLLSLQGHRLQMTMFLKAEATSNEIMPIQYLQTQK